MKYFDPVLARAIRSSMSVMLLASVGTGAYAQEKSRMLEEVVVTAQKRQENLQDVPIAITAISGAELEAKGITDFPGVLHDTPSISFQPHPITTTGGMLVYMRGIGGNNAGNINLDSGVG